MAGRYELEELAGAGGMSSVYRAYDRVLERTVALKILHEHHGADLAPLLHSGPHVTHAQHHLHAFLRDQVAAGAQRGWFRDDVAPGELATFCLSAVAAASSLPSKAAVRRLVTVTVAALRPEA